MAKNSPSRTSKSSSSSSTRMECHEPSRRREGDVRYHHKRERRHHSRSPSRERGHRDHGGRHHRHHGRRHDRSRSRDRSRKERSRSRSRSRRSSGSGSHKSPSLEKVAAQPTGAVQSSTRDLQAQGAPTKTGVSTASFAAATGGASGSAVPPGVSAALAAARAAAVRSGLMSPEALNAPGPLQFQQMGVVQSLAGSLATASGTLPSYYNPSAVNPVKYAEQMHKRRLLWKKTPDNNSSSSSSSPPQQQAQSSGSTAAAGPVSSCAQVWERMTFAQDEGGKVTAKFRKLMGIRTEPPKDPLPPTEADPLLSRQEKLFQDLDQQYEAARMSTHTHRGVGLGYSSQMAAFFQQTNLTK